MEKQPKLGTLQSCPPRAGVELNPDCERLFTKTFRIYSILGRPSSGGIVYEVYDTEKHKTLAVKVLPFNENSISEIDKICQIQKLLSCSPCFLRFEGWFVCTRPPEIWAELRVPPPVLRDSWNKNKLIYYGMEKADMSFEDFNVDNLSYEEKVGFIFEVIHAISCLHDVLDWVHGDIKPDNILISKSVPRIYTISGVDFVVTTPYLPKIADYGETGPGDITEDNMRFFGTLAIKFPDFDRPMATIFSNTDLIQAAYTSELFDVLKVSIPEEPHLHFHRIF